MKDIYIPLACTDVDGSGELVPDPSCLSSTVRDASSQPNPTLMVSPDGSHETSGSLAITVGSVCAAVAVLLLVVIGAVMLILIKKHRQTMKKKKEISEPQSSTQ